MKNIHLIPTEKASEFYSINGKHKLANSTMAMDWYISSVGYKPHNIYITSDEDFNENDYVIKKDGRLVQVSYLLSKDLDGAFKVVIASDPDLIADGVQAIDDEFLEWFVKNPSCEFVEVNKLCYGALSGFADAGYKIIIPQEEPKQEIIATEEDAKIFVDTIENPPDPNENLKRAFEKAMTSSTKNKAAEKWCSEEGFYPDPKQGFIAGANWQQEQSKRNRLMMDEVAHWDFNIQRNYSKEEVLEHLNHLIMMPSSKLDKFTNDEEMVTMKWFEQFKKNKL
jgi:hypothetical protein